MDFISVRDLPTQKRLKKILKNGARIRVGADPALSLGLNPLGREKTRKVLKHRFSNDYKKIGICISAQAPLANLEKLVHLMERISNKKKVVWIGLPMNPKTDTVVLNRIKAELNRPGDLIIMNDLIEPGQVASAAELCDIVVSSRLHLLILSAISRTPFIGISRGSKVDNFAHAFSMPLTGSVEHPDYAQLESLLLTPAREHPISKTDYRKKLSNMNLSLDYVIRALQQFLKSIRA
ncbi:MAG TPA: polysaccharide pyruvyl transferase family protein [Verrucomicrobiales bacterium]|nr:polysaccharide pyruvyl transferase family protein [Verrucomicrobiales bacterium]